MGSELARTSNGTLTTTLVNDEEQRKIFQRFRLVFDARYCTRRHIFWIEKKYGKFIVRCVKTLTRQSKGEDLLIGTTIDDLDAVRLLIVNRVAGQILTGIRWEAYDDFALTSLLISGRYDLFDLAGGMPRDKLVTLARQGLSVPTKIEEWDFDGLLVFHRCPRCQGLCSRDLLTFYPEYFNCEQCGREPFTPTACMRMAESICVKLFPDQAQPSKIVEVKNALHALPVHPVENTDFFPIHAFLDLLSSCVLVWYLRIHQGGSAEGLAASLQCESDFFRPRITLLYQHSIFPLLKVPELRKKFKAHLQEIGIDMRQVEVFIGAAGRVDEILGAPLMWGHDGQCGKRDWEVLFPFIAQSTPLYLNTLVEAYAKQLETQQEQGGA